MHSIKRGRGSSLVATNRLVTVCCDEESEQEDYSNRGMALFLWGNSKNVGSTSYALRLALDGLIGAELQRVGRVDGR